MRRFPRDGLVQSQPSKVDAMIGDIVSKILLQVKGDTSDARRELEKLKGVERERAQSVIDDHKKIEASSEGQLKSLAKLGVAMAAVYGAGKVALDLMRESAAHSRLELAAGAASMDGLKRASKGLTSEMDLLRHAAAFQTGVIKLNQTQMETAEVAMLAFARQGNDTAKSQDAVLKAVTSLKLDGLKDLGVFVDSAGLSMTNQADRATL